MLCSDIGYLIRAHCISRRDAVRFRKKKTVPPIGVFLGAFASFCFGYFKGSGPLLGGCSLRLDIFYVFATLGCFSIYDSMSTLLKTRTKSICLILRCDVILILIRVGLYWVDLGR